MGRNAHPVGLHHHTQHIDSGTLVRHKSPVPGPIRNVCSMNRSISRRALVFDTEYLNRLFRSTGCAICLAGDTKARAMQSTDRDSFGVAAITMLMPDRFLPQEVDSPESKVIDAAMNAAEEEYGGIFLDELDQRGVQGAVTFLEDLVAQRENALAKVNQLYRSVSAHNQNSEATGKTIANALTVVKCASTIIVAGLTLPVVVVGAAAVGIAAGSGLAAFGVGLTYSVSLTVIKNWDHAASADLVLIAGKKGIDKTEVKGTKEVAKMLRAGYEGDAQDASSAARRVDWLTKRVSSLGRGRDIRRLANAKDALKTASTAGKLAVALKAVPYLFFAWSTYQALEGAHEEWQR